jgi:uncharacterized phage protein (TIGR01671 family)
MSNRVIKFRVWDVKYKEFSEEPFFRILIAKDGHIYNSENDEWTKPGERYIINLSTGLKDKNGKEIYEGDIVTCRGYEREAYDFEYTKENPATVTWDNECAGFYPFIKASQWRSEVYDTEIIGNIYESNPPKEVK